VLKEATFAKMLEFLNRRFHVASLQDFLRAIENDQSDSRPWCLLTFDDGWRDNYTTAYPLLRKFQVPATIFLVTGMIGTREVFWVEQLRRSWKNPLQRSQMNSVIAGILPRQNGGRKISLEEFIEFAKHMPSDDRSRLLKSLLLSDQPSEQTDGSDQMMSWDEAAELSRSGVEMGAHTVTHPLLTHENSATVRQEVRLSKKTLEENLTVKVRAFAYPNGDWNEKVREEVEQAEFRCAFATQHGWYEHGGDLFAIPRVTLHEGNVTGLDGKFSPAMFSLTLARWR